MFVLLVGPKGSGKTHIGRALERHLGVRFFHVEPLWLAYHAECKAKGIQPTIPEGISSVHPQIAQALRANEHVCVETTGASSEILDALLTLWSPSKTLVARVSAPLELCLRRLDARDQTNQIAMDIESIRQAHRLSVTADLQPQLTLVNAGLSDTEIVNRFKSALTPP
jgi:shikimate kinase